MKIIISILLMVCLTAAVFCGCSNIEAGKPLETQSSAAISSESSQEEVVDDDLAEVSNEIAEDVNVEVEWETVIVSSVEELKTAISNSKSPDSDNDIYIRHKLNEVEYFYEPAVMFEGYELLHIEVTEHRIFYYYMPEALMQDEEPPYFDYDNGIVFTIARLEDASDNALQPIIDQTGIESNEDNIVFDKKHNSLTWTVDQTWIDIRFPESFTDYDEMAIYCKVTRVVVEN